MGKTLLAAALCVALTLATATTARGDSGSLTTDDGQTCFWFGSGSLYTMSCSGYSRSAGGFISCEYDITGQSVSWRCRDGHGTTWRGSR